MGKQALGRSAYNANRQLLMRVPGIGPKSADKIIAARREARLQVMAQLPIVGMTTGWAAPYSCSMVDAPQSICAALFAPMNTLAILRSKAQARVEREQFGH